IWGFTLPYSRRRKTGDPQALHAACAQELARLTQPPAETPGGLRRSAARLAELRETLGIRFPVYLVVTKMDLLPGFSEYFRTLTSHLRAQIWGFTLPYSRRRKTGDPQALHAACAQELARLT
ncbi:type VI secretion system protein, partial [Salmonella enterica subsp. enterica serovar Typhimurium]